MRMIVATMMLALMATAADARVRCTDAKTGQYVSNAYAKKYPGLTQCADTVRTQKRRKPAD